MKQAKGKALVLVGSVLEAITGVFGLIVAILYLVMADSDFFADVQIGAEQGFWALIGFYGVILLHIAAAVIGFACAGKVKRFAWPLAVGIVLIVITNVFTDWRNASFLTVALNILPGLLMVIGAVVNAKGPARQIEE